MSQRAESSERLMMPMYWKYSLISDNHFFISTAKVVIFL